MSLSDKDDELWEYIVGGIIIALLVLGVFWMFGFFDSKETPVTHQANTVEQPTVIKTTKPTKHKKPTTCIDVTSYDYNWDNDMLCTKPDGTQFYTSYSGASKYGD